MLLEAKGISVRYGRVAAVTDVDIAVDEGQVVTVLGANGAGKSSLLKVLIGLVRPVSGSVHFRGQAITHLSASERVKAGLALVPEGRRILITLTVEENLLLGAYHRRDKAAVGRELDGIYQRFPNLAERRYAKAVTLSGGEQQMLAIGRALVGAPRLMMLDEPSLGLSPLFVSRLFDLLRDLNRNGLAVLLVEQNTGMALEIAHQCHVLELGRELTCGTPAQLKGDKKLQEAYLGG